MPHLKDLTIEQARAEGERLRARREQADREDAPLFYRQLADLTPEQAHAMAELVRVELEDADRQDAAFLARQLAEPLGHR